MAHAHNQSYENKKIGAGRAKRSAQAACVISRKVGAGRICYVKKIGAGRICYAS